jgi:hypothetical protein
MLVAAEVGPPQRLAATPAGAGPSAAAPAPTRARIASPPTPPKRAAEQTLAAVPVPAPGGDVVGVSLTPNSPDKPMLCVGALNLSLCAPKPPLRHPAHPPDGA